MIHNEYAAPSGEEIQFNHIVDILRSHDHDIYIYRRNSDEIERMTFGKLRAFMGGIYNPYSLKNIAKVISEFNPDCVFLQNLYPLISPSILPIIRKSNIPVIMRVANYRLMCPNGLHLSHGVICERCLYDNEYWCLLKNCEDNVFKSFGYALRNMISRRLGWFKNNISSYICASGFLKKRMENAGFEKRRIYIIPNLIPDHVFNEKERRFQLGSYVGYAGRISREKGINVIIDAARRCPDMNFRFAGRLSSSFKIPRPLPQNVEFVGFLQGNALHDFYRNARIIVSASECYETFGISIAEAMLHKKPVIASRIGIFPEFVQDGVNGLLFDMGNSGDLAGKIDRLWNNEVLCINLGNAGRMKVIHDSSPEVYYHKFMEVCEKSRAYRLNSR